jgi:GT2 family glycosyltransferase
VLENTFHPNFEIVIVDNNSSDETLAIAQRYSAADQRIRIIPNERNLGFAGGNNLAAQAAKGEVFVLLNPDTAVSAGWLGRLLRVLALEPDVDLVSAVTNFAGNEIKINWSYDTYEEMRRFAEKLAVDKFDQRLEVAMAPLMACALRRDVWTGIGGLDDQYAHGMFEDDDFCMRIREGRRRIVTAEDCFVHHFGQASFSQLDPATYDAIFQANQRRFSQRWGDWKPHQVRPKVRPVHEERRLTPRAFFEDQLNGSPRRDRWTRT